ncbi:sodium-coupled monocarboxylate transporter 1-like isoform X1 [Schistocerca piceifrons]|uniref:sodium-coupled monocarboxylate transporter 1-like isoform X1 n=1 Tax=Schistocerca piceifrons TaxID=274613 RepID=UPI001F5EBF61|nr:sodium-coupled monocarboxylate transporter 1-like isoform X1 [Schistocerca piceifrons]XP_047119827.1 sodium-coupled monocarboxylate transporter 1-like isoform X1 [Schistocerca piceifrons]
MDAATGSAPVLGAVDYAVFGGMLLVSAAIGVYYGFFARSSGADAYLVGGRSMSTIPVSLSLIASFISGITLLGMATESYLYGVQYSYICLAVLLSGVVSAFAFLPVFHDLGITSAYEYLEMRFGKSVRLLGSFFFMVGVTSWIPIVVYVPAIAFNQVTGVNMHIVSSVVCLVCIFYTCVGGLRAVVWTDAVQTLVMFGGVVLVVVKGTLDVGGFGVVWSRNVDSGRIEPPLLDWNPTARLSLASVLVGGTVHLMAIASVDQMMMQRYLSLPTLARARLALCVFTVGVMSLVLLSTYSGLLIFARYYDCDPLTTKMASAKDQLLPLLVVDSLGGLPGLPGLFVASVFSAALSSMSTALNSTSAVVLEDFFKTFFPSRRLSERQTDLLMKAVVVVMGAVCTGLVFAVERLGASVLQITISFASITTGPILALFTAGMFLPWVNTMGALAGGLGGAGLMSWLILGAQAYQASGDIRFATKPFSTEGCLYEFDRANNGSVAVPADYRSSWVWPVFAVSHVWYTALGWLLALAVSLAVSAASGGWGSSRAHWPQPRLLSPLVRRWLPAGPPHRDYKVVELRIVQAKEDKGTTNHVE